MDPESPRWEPVQIGPRAARPVRRVDAYLAVAVTALACTLYVATLFTDVLPSRGLAVLLFSAAPVCATYALLVLAVRARAESDAMLRWFAGGLAVSLLALVFQLISYPLVMSGGGYFGTSDDGSAGLYLLVHLALVAGALAGAFGVRPGALWPSVVAGLVLAALLASDAIPLPELLRPDATYTRLLIGMEYALAGLVAAAAILWVLRAGRAALALRGWVGVALSLLAYELLLNAVGGERFGSVWWASLSLRVATFFVLAAGSIGAVLAALRDQETYAGAELARRESQLRYSFRVTSQLLSCADDLARAVTPQEVGDVLCADALKTTGMSHTGLALLSQDGSEFTLLASSGYSEEMRQQVERFDWDAPLPGPRVILTGEPLFLTSPEEIRRQFPTVVEWPARAAAAMAALPIKVGDAVTGVLLVWGERSTTWPALQRGVLTGLVAQGGQALARAIAFESERDVALTLQESLLPARLPRHDRLSLAARYVPGERGLHVGGDWYDCVEIDEHRIALVVGDVMGKGLRAATLMGQIRTGVRALATVDPSPTAVLSALDRFPLDLETDEIATVVYMLFDTSTGDARVARAGHLPPLLVSPTGAVTFVEDGGSPPLGAPMGLRPEGRFSVPPEGMLVLYTDGAVEDRRRGLDLLPELASDAARLAAQYRPDAEAFVEALLAEIRTSERLDDVALLVAEYRPCGVAPHDDSQEDCNCSTPG